MAGQGNRIWTTRLVVVSVAILVILGFAANRVWKRLTQTPIEITSNGTSTNVLTTSGSGSGEKQEGEPKSDSVVEHHPLAPVLKMAQEALQRHRKEHTGYTAVMLKTERIDGKLSPQATMKLKLRYLSPNDGSELRNVAVYLDFLGPPKQKGREVIYYHGKNDNMLLAHEGGFLGIITVPLAPNSRIAMIGNRYPITEVGLEKLLVRLIEKGERDSRLGDCVVNRRSGEMIEDRRCELIEVIHNEKTVTIGDKTIPHEFHIARIWFDESIMLPIKYASYSWPTNDGEEPILEEEYQYNDLVLNPELTDIDFDTENPNYRY